jgi:ParB family chromosome partitioning protein
MKLEFHQLERRYEHLRARNRDQQRRLLASIAVVGQQTPIVVVAIADQANRYQVIDGYKRIAVLEQLGRDTVEAIVWEMSEADALVLERSIRFSERETALEEGWLLSELEQRFGYGLEELARRFDRSVSWVSRRLALIEQIPETVQQRVRNGAITAHIAMKYLVPVARANASDCERMAEAFAKHRFSSRQASEIYAAWRDASPSIRERILQSPELFLKAQEQVEPQPAPPAEELLRDLTMVVAITNRANRRFARAQPLMSPNELESAQRKIESALKDLTRLSERIDKENTHVESKPTHGDSGTPRPGDCETRDRTSSERIAPERPQNPAVTVFGSALAAPARESRSLSGSDSGAVSLVQGQSRPGP